MNYLDPVLLEETRPSDAKHKIDLIWSNRDHLKKKINNILILENKGVWKVSNLL